MSGNINASSDKDNSINSSNNVQFQVHTCNRVCNNFSNENVPVQCYNDNVEYTVESDNCSVELGKKYFLWYF